MSYSKIIMLDNGKYTGKPMTSARLNNLFYQLQDRTGIEAHPHLFRHTFATRILQAGYLDQAALKLSYKDKQTDLMTISTWLADHKLLEKVEGI